MKLYCGSVVLCLVGCFACTTLHVLVYLQLSGLSVECTTAAPQKRSAEGPKDLVCGASVFPLWTVVDKVHFGTPHLDFPTEYYNSVVSEEVALCSALLRMKKM